jgi:hypothetical protein
MNSITVKKIKKLKPVVQEILEQSPKARDDDKLLILKVWAHQNPNIRKPDFPFVNFAALFLDNQYAETESIRRTRQKLQEEMPELRGELYKNRHKEAGFTRKEIKE